MAKTIADLLVRIGADSGDLQKELAATKRQLKSSLGGYGMTIASGIATGAAAAGAALVGLGAYAVKAAGGFQNVQAAMTNMLGSAEKANAFISDLQEFAAKTPFDFQGIAQASQKLLAFGFTADQILPTMRAIGDAAAALGAGQEGIDRITLSLGQMAAKGRVQADEMLQLTEAGIPAWQMLADTIGTSIPEAMDRVSKGQITAQQGLEALVNGMETQFAGLMDQQSEQILGSWGNLMDGLEQSAVAVGLRISDALDLPDLFSGLGDQLQQFARDVNTSGISEALGNLIPPEMETVIYAVGGAIAASLTAGLIALAPAIAGAAAGFAALIAPLLPLIAAGAALGIVVGALVDPMGTLPGLLELFGVSSYDAESYVRDLCDAVSGAVDWVASLTDYIPNLADTFPVLTGVINEAADALRNFMLEQSRMNTPGGWLASLFVDDSQNGAYHGLTAADDRVKEYQKALQGGNGLRVLDYDEATGTFSDPDQKKVSFSNFGGGAPSGAAGGGGGGSGGRASRLAQEAARTSSQIEDAYARTFDRASQEADLWYADQLDNLNKSAAENQNYQEDLQKLNELYAQKRRKADAEEASEKMQLYEKVRSAAEASESVQNVYGSASQQALKSMEMDYGRTVDNITKRWQTFENEYLGMTDQERQALLEQFDAQGIAYEVYEDGRLSLAEQTSEDIAAAEKAYGDKRVKYYAQVKDLQADIDEAYERNSMSMLRAALTDENAARLAAYNEQKAAMDAFYENWQEMHESTAQKITDSIQDSKSSFDNFFSDVLTGSQSFLESLGDLFTNIWGNIVGNFTSSWGASISNGLLGMFGLGGDAGTGMTDTEGGGFSGASAMGSGLSDMGSSSSMTDLLGGFANAVVGSTNALGANSGALGTATGLLGMFSGTTQKGSSLLGTYNNLQNILNTTTKPKETVTTVTATTALGAFTSATITATAALEAMSASGGFFGGLFASGGIIRGPGSGTSDSIPARLSNGEYVLNAQAVKKWGLPLLNALNEGRMPAFASGGPVTRPTFSRVRLPDLEKAVSAAFGGEGRMVSVAQNIYGDINTGADQQDIFDQLNQMLAEGMRS